MKERSDIKFSLEDEKKKLSQLHGRKRLEYIWEYYKLGIGAICVVLLLSGYIAYKYVTHTDTVLYAGMVNVMPGEELAEKLGDGYLISRDIDMKKNSFMSYPGLYLTTEVNGQDAQVAYASQMKIVAGIEADELDVVLMDENAFNICAKNSYLCDISKLLSEKDPKLYEKLKPYIVNNERIIKDNASDVALDPEIGYEAETEEYPMAVDLSEAPMIKEAVFGGKVYLGVIWNSPRTDTAVDYIKYLYEE